MFCNIPMGVPSAMTFGKYHADHHNFLGEIEYDPDFPLRLEAKWSMHNIYKSFFLFLYTFEYALKPLLLYPKMFTLHELLNIIFIVATDYAIVKQWGWSALLFMILSSFFATGPHPTALHLIA